MPPTNYQLPTTICKIQAHRLSAAHVHVWRGWFSMFTCRFYFGVYLQGYIAASLLLVAPSGSTPLRVPQESLPRSAMEGKDGHPRALFGRSSQRCIDSRVAAKYYQPRQYKRKAPAASGSMLGTPLVAGPDATKDGADFPPDPFATPRLHR